MDDDLRQLIEDRLAHLDALELAILGLLPEEKRADARQHLAQIEKRRLQARILALDQQSGNLSARSAEILESWLRRERLPPLEHPEDSPGEV